MKRQLTQTTTDTVECEDFGPVTLCTFNWAGNNAGPTRLVATSKASAASRARRRPVDAISEIESLCVLTDAGLDVVRRLGPGALHLLTSFDTGYDALTTTFVVETDDLRAFLADRSEEDIRSRTFAVADGTLFDLDSGEDDLPLNFPIIFSISDRYVDVAAARGHLESHPLVRALAYDSGRPGSHDHIPRSLLVSVALPDDVRAAVEIDYRAQHARHRRAGERVAAGGYTLELSLVASLSTGGRPHGDPLGLAPFARRPGSYLEPGDDD